MDSNIKQDAQLMAQYFFAPYELRVKEVELYGEYVRQWKAIPELHKSVVISDLIHYEHALITKATGYPNTNNRMELVEVFCCMLDLFHQYAYCAETFYRKGRGVTLIESTNFSKELVVVQDEHRFPTSCAQMMSIFSAGESSQLTDT